jgi:hypothetical protein
VIGVPVRSAANQAGRYSGRLALFALSLLVASAAMGMGLGFVGSQIVPWGRTLLTATALALGVAVFVREIVAPGLPLPHRHWQIPRSWTTPFWRSAVAFGAIMGTGLLTRTSSALFYLYVFACLASGSATIGVTVGLIFGVTFVLVVIAATLRRGPPAAEADFVEALAGRARVAGALAAPMVVTLPGAWPF